MDVVEGDKLIDISKRLWDLIDGKYITEEKIDADGNVTIINKADTALLKKLAAKFSPEFWGDAPADTVSEAKTEAQTVDEQAFMDEGDEPAEDVP